MLVRGKEQEKEDETWVDGEVKREGQDTRELATMYAPADAEPPPDTLRLSPPPTSVRWANSVR